jgi:hypothetical protein
MEIKLIKENGVQYDITNICIRVSWSGSASQAARSVEFDYPNAPYDKFLQIPTVCTGDYISLSETNEGEIFFGQIFGIERSSQIGSITYSAYDMMKHLLESTGQYNFKNITAEAIAAQVCADVQVPVKYLYSTGINIKSMICNKMSLYDIIMAGYTKAHKVTGDKYFSMIYQRGFSVYKSEWSVAGFILSDKTNIYESSISETMDSIKNQIKVYDEKGKQIGELKNDESIKKFGVFQEVYTKEEGIDFNTVAKNLMKVNPSQNIKISALGNIKCLSCYFATVSDEATGLSGRYWIGSDKHTWENGTYKMELELEFDSIMDKKEAEEEKR